MAARGCEFYPASRAESEKRTSERYFQHESNRFKDRRLEISPFVRVNHFVVENLF